MTLDIPLEEINTLQLSINSILTKVVELFRTIKKQTHIDQLKEKLTPLINVIAQKRLTKYKDLIEWCNANEELIEDQSHRIHQHIESDTDTNAILVAFEDIIHDSEELSRTITETETAIADIRSIINDSSDDDQSDETDTSEPEPTDTDDGKSTPNININIDPPDVNITTGDNIANGGNVGDITVQGSESTSTSEGGQGGEANAAGGEGGSAESGDANNQGLTVTQRGGDTDNSNTATSRGPSQTDKPKRKATRKQRSTKRLSVKINGHSISAHAKAKTPFVVEVRNNGIKAETDAYIAFQIGGGSCLKIIDHDTTVDKSIYKYNIFNINPQESKVFTVELLQDKVEQYKAIIQNNIDQRNYEKANKYRDTLINQKLRIVARFGEEKQTADPEDVKTTKTAPKNKAALWYDRFRKAPISTDQEIDVPIDYPEINVPGVDMSHL